MPSTIFAACSWIRGAATVLAVAALTACGWGSPPGDTERNGSKATAADAPPTWAELANATYSGVFDEPVTLTDGRWEGSPYVEGGASRPSAGLVDDFILTGDLNGDGRDDAAVLVWESSGGSGTRSYLAVMGRVGRAVVNLGTGLIGDRVQVKEGVIADGQITLDLIQAGPGDAACCPSQKALVRWQLADGRLAQAASEFTGTLSLGDLEGPEWVLAAIGWGTPVPEGTRVDITFDGGRVAGSSGCNSYFGTVTSEAPGQLGFGAMGSTMMNCPDPSMDFERRYLRTLAGGSSYGFVAGRLVIGCQIDDALVSLVFKRPRATTPVLDGGP